MKALCFLIALVGVIFFINEPAATAERTAETLGIEPVFAIGAVAIAGLFFLLRGSRTPRGR
jgi:hypothetical protein